jgi:hypothetical protein
MKHSDANIYVVRHEYTEKYMLKMITEKYHNDEIKHLGLFIMIITQNKAMVMVMVMATVMATATDILMKIKIIKNLY